MAHSTRQRQLRFTIVPKTDMTDAEWDDRQKRFCASALLEAKHLGLVAVPLDPVSEPVPLKPGSG